MTRERPGAPPTGRGARALDRVRELLSPGHGGALLLVGGPGSGKTAVLDEAARLAADAVVLRADGVGFEVDLDLSALHQVLLPMTEQIAGLAPPHRAALAVVLGSEDGPVPPRAVLDDAVLALLRQVARTRRVLILVDDLQWVDRATVGVLRHVGRHLHDLPAVLVATVRPGAATSSALHGWAEHELDPRDDGTAPGDGLPEPTRRAWHLAGAARGPDEHVARALQDAAVEALRRGDATGAVATLTRAAELTPPGRGRGRRIARAAWIGAEVTGELRAVPRLLRDAEVTDPHVATSLPGVAAAAHLLLNGDGDVDTAFGLLATAVDHEIVTRTGAVDDSLVEALHTLLMVCNFACRTELWTRFHALVARVRPQVPELFELCVWSMGDAARTPASVIDRVLAHVDGLRHETDPLQIKRVAMAAFYVERMEHCRDALWRVVRDGQTGGAAASAISALNLLAADAFHTGRWDEAGDLAAQASALCEAHGYQLLAAPGRLVRSLLAAARGDGDTVRALTDELVNWGFPRGAHRLVVYAGEARGLAALGRADFEDAYRELAAVSPPGALEPGNGHLLWLAFDLVEAAVRTHRRAEAAAHVAVLREVGTARLAPRHALVAAGAAALTAPEDRAGELFESALALDGGERWPFDLARIRLAYGEHLRRSRATTAAREQLSRALETFTRLGARPWTARATTELRATGHDPDRRSPGRHDLGQADLTPQEREVAGLAASGMTNQQIADRLGISRRTVDSHLYRVFPKLGIRGRAALRDALDGHRG